MKSPPLLLALVFLALNTSVVSASAAGPLTDGSSDWITGFGSGYEITPLAGDVDNDGKADAVSVTSGGLWYVAPSTGNRFGPSYSYWIGMIGPRAALADMNGDGKLDAIGGSATGNTWNVALNTGNGFAAPTTSNGILNVSPQTNVAVGDADGNHVPDLVTNYGGRLWVADGTSTGFRPPRAATAPGSTTFGVASGTFLADVNLDGKADAVGVSNGIWRVRLSTSNGGTPSFAYESTWASNLGPNADHYAMADVNGDGRKDAIAQTGDVWSVGLSNGWDSFSAAARWDKSFLPPTSSLPTGILAADVTGDGSMDPISVMNGAWRVGAGLPVPDQIKAAGSGWTRTLNEDFSTLDSNRWNTSRYDYWLAGTAPGGSSLAPYNGPYEGSTSKYKPENSSVVSGNLVQTITDAGGGNYGIPSINSLGRIDANTGGYLPQTGFRFRRGYVEAKIRVPGCTGCWPAFFLLPAPPTPTSPMPPPIWTWPGKYPEEVDIFEFFPNRAAPANLNANYNLHWGTSSNAYELNRTNDSGGILPTQVLQGADPTGNFHKYGCLVTDGYVQFFIDNYPGPKVTLGTPQQDLYLILTLQRMDADVGDYHYHATTPFGSHMDTDYIEVWE